MADVTVKLKAEDKASPVLKKFDKTTKNAKEELDRFGKTTKKAKEELERFSRATKKASKETNKTRVSFKSFDNATEKVRLGLSRLRNRLLLASFAVGLLGFAFKKIVSLSIIQEKAEAKLNQTLLSTKSVAGLTADELTKMASSLQSVTTFGDETIISAQALLLTFTNISKDAFPRAIELALDLSVAMGQDLKSSVIQLGKALNAPKEGISALSRVGIQFTEQQKSQIKALEKANKTFEAQTIIMDELAKQFGGQAQADAKDFGGQITQMSNAFGDLLESVGFFITESKNLKFIIPGLTKLFGFVAEKIKVMSKEAKAASGNLGLLNKAQTKLNDLQATLSASISFALSQMTEFSEKSRKALELEIDETKTLIILLQKRIDKAKADEAARLKAIQDAKDLIAKEKEVAKLKAENDKRAFEFFLAKERATEDIRNAELKAFEAQFEGEEKVIEKKKENIALTAQQMIGVNLLSGSINGLANGIARSAFEGENFGKTMENVFKQMAIEITALIIKMAIFRAFFPGGAEAGGFAGAIGSALGVFQTPAQGTRKVPGPSNLAVPAIVHGGETISRGQSSGGGLTINGNVFGGDAGMSELNQILSENKMRNGFEA